MTEKKQVPSLATFPNYDDAKYSVTGQGLMAYLMDSRKWWIDFSELLRLKLAEAKDKAKTGANKSDRDYFYWYGIADAINLILGLEEQKK